MYQNIKKAAAIMLALTITCQVGLGSLAAINADDNISEQVSEIESTQEDLPSSTEDTPILEQEQTVDDVAQNEIVDQEEVLNSDNDDQDDSTNVDEDRMLAAAPKPIKLGTFGIYGAKYPGYANNKFQKHEPLLIRKYDLNQLLSKTMSFDGLILSEGFLREPDPEKFNQTVVGEDGMTYQCIGFIPYKGSVDEDIVESNIFSDLDQAKKVLEENHGIAYGSTVTENDISTLKSHRIWGDTLYMVTVWYRYEKPIDKGNYGDLTIHSGKPISFISTSQGVSFEINEKEHAVTVVLTKNAPKDVHININQSIRHIMDVYMKESGYNEFQPGDHFDILVQFRNDSGRTYDFINGSAQFGPSFTEDSIPGIQNNRSYIPWRMYNAALTKLHCQDLSDEAIGQALIQQGYGSQGESPVSVTMTYLDDYYLDYFNSLSDTKYASFLEVPGNLLSTLTDSQERFEMMEESNPTLRSLYYYMYYGMILSVNGEGIWQTMIDNTSFNADVNSRLLSGDQAYNLHIASNGEWMNNAYQNTTFTFGMQWDMKEREIVVPVTPSETPDPVNPPQERPTNNEVPESVVVVEQRTQSTKQDSSTKLHKEEKSTKAKLKTEEIKEEGTPKAGGAAWALINLICAILTVLFGLLLLLSKRHKDQEDEEQDQEEQVIIDTDEEEEEETPKKRGMFTRVIAVIVALISVIFFILTEDMRLPMIWIDKYTIWMVVILLVQVIVFFIGRRWKEDSDEQEESAE